MLVLCEQSELQVAFGNELVQLLLGRCEVTHLPLQLLMPGNQRSIDSVPTVREGGAQRFILKSHLHDFNGACRLMSLHAAVV